MFESPTVLETIAFFHTSLIINQNIAYSLFFSTPVFPPYLSTPSDFNYKWNLCLCFLVSFSSVKECAHGGSMILEMSWAGKFSFQMLVLGKNNEEIKTEVSFIRLVQYLSSPDLIFLSNRRKQLSLANSLQLSSNTGQNKSKQRNGNDCIFSNDNLQPQYENYAFLNQKIFAQRFFSFQFMVTEVSLNFNHKYRVLNIGYTF